MSIPTLIRYAHEDYTDGIITVNNRCFYTLEKPWKNNKRNISCFPDGIHIYKKDHSTRRNRVVVELVNVHNRSELQFHTIGKFTNKKEDQKKLKGCVGFESKEIELEFTDLMPDHGFIRVRTINKHLEL